MLTPGTIAELAAALHEAASAGQTIETGGAFSKRAMGGGGTGASADITITLSGMTRLIEYEPNDLTVSVEAGMKWRVFQELLAANRQMVPLDPPYYDDATVGGVLAANTCGPRRRQYGSPRDVVIGMRFAAVSGEIIQSGGMVVKNVAGLDIGKLMIGSFGTLGVIGEANFKVSPVPPVSATFVQQAGSVDEIMRLRNQVLAGVLQPAAIDIVKGANSRDWKLALQVGATEKVMQRYRRELAGAQFLDGEAEAAFWGSIREFAPSWLSAHAGGAIVRVSVALQEVGAVLAAHSGPAVARAGNGVIYCAFGEAESAAAWAKSSPYPAVVEASAPGAAIERWPRPGGAIAVMERVKRMFDPSNLLNRGRLYGRL